MEHVRARTRHGMAPSHRAADDGLFASEVKPMNVVSNGAPGGRAGAVGRFVLAVGLMEAINAASAYAQHGQARANVRPPQPIGNQSAAHGQGRYTPYPVTDPTASERAVVAGRVYWTILAGWVQQAMAPPGPAQGPPDKDAVFSLELAERLGQWSLRWQDAQDNAAKSLAGRYQALSDHLGRMSALADGQFLRDAVDRVGVPNGRRVESKPPRLFSEIARFFRPVDEQDIDRIVPEIVEFERPLNPLGVAVTAAERADIAGRVYGTILAAAVDRFLAPPRAGEAQRDEAAVFDARLAERLANWSDMWRQAQDDAATDTLSRSAVARNSPARLALAGTRLAGPDAFPATVKAHIERMSALETGRFGDDALRRAGRPAGEHLDMTQLPEFVAVVRFFRIEAESQQPNVSTPKGIDLAASSRAAAASQVYQSILDGAARRYLAIPHAGGAPADAHSIFDARLAERLGFWSIHWGRALAGAGGSGGSRFAALRAHFERMASLEDGRALHDACNRAGARAGGPDAPAPPRDFAAVARFFRLEARWELELVKSR